MNENSQTSLQERVLQDIAKKLPEGFEVDENFIAERVREKMREDAERLQEEAQERFASVGQDANSLRDEISMNGDISGEEKDDLVAESRDILYQTERSKSSFLGSMAEWMKKTVEQKSMAREEKRTRARLEKKLFSILEKAYIASRPKEKKFKAGNSDKFADILRRIRTNEDCDMSAYRADIETLYDEYQEERAKFADMPLSRSDDMAVSMSNFEYAWKKVRDHLLEVLTLLGDHLSKKGDIRGALSVQLKGGKFNDTVRFGIIGFSDGNAFIKPEYRDMLVREPWLYFGEKERNPSNIVGLSLSAAEIPVLDTEAYEGLIRVLLTRDDARQYLDKIPWRDSAVRAISDNLKQQVCAKGLREEAMFIYRYDDIFFPYIERTTVHDRPAKEVLSQRFRRHVYEIQYLGEQFLSSATKQEFECQEKVRVFMEYFGIDTQAVRQALESYYKHRMVKKEDEKTEHLYRLLARIIMANLPAYLRDQGRIQEEFGVSFVELKPYILDWAKTNNLARPVPYTDLAQYKEFFSQDELILFFHNTVSSYVDPSLAEHSSFEKCRNMSVDEAARYVASTSLSGKLLKSFIWFFGNQSYVPFSFGSKRFVQLLAAVDSEHRIEMARLLTVSDIISHVDSFSDVEIKEIIQNKTDDEMASVPLVDVVKYLSHDRLVEVAKRHSFFKIIDLKDMFSPIEILSIAIVRPLAEVLMYTGDLDAELIGTVLSHRIENIDGGYLNQHSHGDTWQKLFSNMYSGSLSDFPQYNFSAGVTRENALFALVVYAHTPDENLYGELKTLVERFTENIKDENGKKLLLQSVRGLRDRLLNLSGDAPAISAWEKGILEIVGKGELLHMRVTDLTCKFARHLGGVGEWSTNGALKQEDIATQQSLISKMENKKGVRYSDVEMANYYEQYLAGVRRLPDATRSVVQIFDMLPQDKRLYVAYQEGVLAPLSVLATLSAEVENLDIGAVVNICAGAREELSQAQDQASQEKSIEIFSAQMKELLRASVEKVFGLRIPDVSPEQVDAILPLVTYSTHIAGKNEDKVALLGLFAALRLSGQWDAFKRGEPVDIDKYLTDELRAKVKTYQEKRGELDIFFQSDDSPLHISAEVMPKWFKKLAEPSETVLTGESRGVLDSIHAIDAMAKDILDPDNFQEGQEQLIWQLVQEFGVKKVGGALAKRFKEGGFTDEVITSDVGVRLFGQAQGNEKQRLPVWQKLTKCFGQIVGFAEKIQQAGLHERISSVDALLIPSKEIIDIFHKIGEEMSTESGVQSLTEDVEYLESLLLKNQQNVTPEELGRAQQYLSSVKKEITALYHMRDELKVAFETMARAAGQTTEISSRLSERIKGFQSVFEKTTSDSVTYIATMTGDLVDVIPNIRQCLGCKTSECNNDTNLTFGDRNRFLLLGRRAGDAAGSSRSDELVTMQKTVGDGQERYSFVMDNVYGDRARDILLANVSAVVKKMRELRRVSPDTPLDVFVTASGLSSCNVDEQYLQTRLKKEFKGLTIASVTREVHIAQSASGDGHYEIGGGFGGRVKSGVGSVSGISIEWRPESK